MDLDPLDGSFGLIISGSFRLWSIAAHPHRHLQRRDRALLLIISFPAVLLCSLDLYDLRLQLIPAHLLSVQLPDQCRVTPGKLSALDGILSHRGEIPLPQRRIALSQQLSHALLLAGRR